MTLRTEPQSNWRQQREYFIKCYTKLCSSSLDIVEGSEITFNDLANEISEQLTSSVYPEIIAKQKKGNNKKHFKKGEKAEAVAVVEAAEVVEEEVRVEEEVVAEPVVEVKKEEAVVEEVVEVAAAAEEVAVEEAEVLPEPEVQEEP